MTSLKMNMSETAWIHSEKQLRNLFFTFLVFPALRTHSVCRIWFQICGTVLMYCQKSPNLKCEHSFRFAFLDLFNSLLESFLWGTAYFHQISVVKAESSLFLVCCSLNCFFSLYETKHLWGHLTNSIFSPNWVSIAIMICSILKL